MAYVTRGTRRDAIFITAVLQCFSSNYGWKMVQDLEWLINYLVTTRDRMLIFHGGYDGNHELFGMADASYAGCPITRRSHGGYVIYYLGCPILTACKKQAIVALSSCESEFMTAFDCAKALLWTTRLLQGMNVDVQLPAPILEDNNAAIQLSRRPSLNSGNSRHMEVRWHWLQTQVKQRSVTLVYVPTEWQVTDLFTKGLGKAIFTRLSPLLMGEERFNTGAVRTALTRIEREASNRVQQAHMFTTMTEEKSSIGTTALRAGNRAWSPEETQQAKQRAQNGPNYPAPGSIVAVFGSVGPSMRYHHLTCSALHYDHDARRSLAFHSDVRITTTGAACDAGFSTCKMCGARLLRLRGG